MKKLLTVLIALSMVAGSFAAEPVANVDMVDFSGEASVTWGMDLENGNSGFKNETDINLTLQFLPDDMSKSTSGSGVWGELVLKVDGATKVEADGVSEGSSPVAVFDAVTVDTAKIHVGNLYFGIQDGDFDFGDDYYFPNALNYANDDESGAASSFVRSTAPVWGYNQGVTLGYAADNFSVEGSVRTKIGGDSFNAAAIDAIAIETFVEAGKSYTVSSTAANVKYFLENDKATAVTIKDGKYTHPTGGSATTLYRVTYKLKDATYMTNDYAIGLEVEVKPIENLRVGVGAAYGVYAGGSDLLNKEGDFSLFVGADYVMNLSETASIVPAITYNMYSDSLEDYTDADGKKQEKGAFTNLNSLGLGAAYRWGTSEDSSSLIEDFYGTKVAYNDADEGDDLILPGVSVFTRFDLMGKETLANNVISKNENGFTGMEKNLPMLVEFYSGDIAAVPGLKVFGMFYANLGAKASENGFATAETAAVAVAGGDAGKYSTALQSASKSESAMDKGMQFALATSYAIPVGDMTVTPSVGALYRYSTIEGKLGTTAGAQAGKKLTLSNTDFLPVVRVDLTGAVANTTFTTEWSGSSYAKSTAKLDTNDAINEYAEDNGEITFKAKIAL